MIGAGKIERGEVDRRDMGLRRALGWMVVLSPAWAAGVSMGIAMIAGWVTA